MRLRALAVAVSVAFALAGCGTFHTGALPDTPADAKFADVAGARVHYVDQGQGPTVVMIHGFASSLGTWRPLVPALAKDHRVIALDLKGFGLTDRPPGDYSPAAQAELVWALLKSRGVEGPVSIVAHSWGSSVALSMALSKPASVERIALYDAWVYQDQLPTFFLVARAPGVGEVLIDAFYEERPDDKMAMAFHDPRYVTEELVENVEKQLARPGTRAAALAAIRGQHYEEVEAKYATIDKPVLLLWGREDRVTRLEFGERLSRELPNARLVVYPGCGHFPMIEAKAPSTRDLVEFLRPAATGHPASTDNAVAPSPPPPASPIPQAGSPSESDSEPPLPSSAPASAPPSTTAPRP